MRFVYVRRLTLSAALIAGVVACTSAPPCPTGSTRIDGQCLADITLENSDPLDGAMAAKRSASLTLSFSRPIDSATANSESIILRNGRGQKVPASLTVQDNQVTIVPVAKLAPSSTYSISVEPTLRGVEQQRMAENIKVEFTTAKGAWSGVKLLAVKGIQSASLAMGPNGNAMAAWQQIEAGKQAIYASHYQRSSSTWSAAKKLSDAAATHAQPPVVAIGPQDQGLVVWTQSSGGFFSVVASAFNAAGEFTPAEELENEDAGDAQSPLVAFDGGGNAFVVWEQWSGANQIVRVNRYSAGGWEGERGVGTVHASGYSWGDHHLAVDAVGNATVIWQRHASPDRVAVNRYTLGAGWGDVVNISHDDEQVSSPSIATDAEGGVVAVWLQTKAEVRQFATSRFVTGSGWAAPESTSEVPYGPFIFGADAAGSQLALWWGQEGDASYNIFANRRDRKDEPWASAMAIGRSAAAEGELCAEISFDAVGNAVCGWLEKADNKWRVMISQYALKDGWASPLEVSDAVTPHPVVARFNASGDGMAVWSQVDALWFITFE